MIYKASVICLCPVSPASPPISLQLMDSAPDIEDHSQFPACALVIETSAPPERLSLLPLIQPDLQTQSSESYVLQKLSQLALTLGSLPETIRHLLLRSS